MYSPFHYAFKVKNIASTKRFYIDILGCKEGRFTDTWYDFDFFGHQLSAHISDHIPELDYCGVVDGVSVPIPHYGCLLTMDQFDSVQAQLKNAGIKFLLNPQTRYAGQVGEQKTMFVFDFSGNPIEFKAYRNAEEVFAG